MAVRIPSDRRIHPTSLCMSFLPGTCSHLTPPSCRMFQIQIGDCTWLGSHRGTGATGTASPVPTASGCAPTPACHQGHQHGRTPTAGSRTSSFICIIYKGYSLALWSWLSGSRWIREAPGTPQDVALGMLGAAPTESLNSLSWKAPSADHPAPTPLKGRDTFHKTFQ